MQCTCPSYNAHNSYSLNRRHPLQQHQNYPVNSNNKAGGVKWYSSQTLPNPKRRHTDYKAPITSCSCDSSSCIFTRGGGGGGVTARGAAGRTPRNVIDPRSGNPVKSCLNISTASSSVAPRNFCYLCTASNTLQPTREQPPRVPHDLHKRRRSEQFQLKNAENLGPYLVSNSEFVTSHLPQRTAATNLERNQLRYSNKSISSCPAISSPSLVSSLHLQQQQQHRHGESGITPWRCCCDSICGQFQAAVGSSHQTTINNPNTHNWSSSAQSLANYYSQPQRDFESNSTSLVNIFSDATQYQQPSNPLLFDDSLCQPNYLQQSRNNSRTRRRRSSSSRGRPTARGEGGESFVEMTAGSCLSSNHGSPPSSPPPLNIPPPPLPPLSRAPSLGGGGSIGRAAGSTLLRHNGTNSSNGCSKCRFAVIATPTHGNRQQPTTTTSNGSVCGYNYSHFGYNHQHHHNNNNNHQQKGGGTPSHHHYGSSNSYSGEWQIAPRQESVRI